MALKKTTRKKTTRKRTAARGSATFKRLRALLKPYDAELDVRRDEARGYEAWCTGLWHDREMFFAGVREGKSYVCFYLFPVYTHPELLRRTSAELKRRMQGKSCFNFETLDPALEKSLGALIQRGFARYRKQGLV